MTETQTDTPIRFGGNTLSLDLAPGEHVYIRRSSLIYADGEFALTTEKVLLKSVNIFSIFSSEVRWSNRYEATGETLTLVAGRDFHGTIAEIDVSPERPLHLQPGLYLGHRGDLKFDTKRVAKKEFWTLTEAIGTGTVFIKLPGRPDIRLMGETGAIVDTNYVAAVSGPFEAHGKVFKAKEVMKSGELENVRLTGDGQILFQSENPEEGAGGGGGIISSLIDLLPF